MAYDLKYGRVTTELGTLGEDEPVIVFRAQDELLPKVLDSYEDDARQAGSPQEMLDLIRQTRREVELWQEKNRDRVKLPD